MDLSLTPLHFEGMRDYSTHCYRFIIEKRGKLWGVSSCMIHSYRDEWAEWLAVTALDDQDFTTRRATMEALKHALLSDGLLKLRSPATVLATV